MMKIFSLLSTTTFLTTSLFPISITALPPPPSSEHNNPPINAATNFSTDFADPRFSYTVHPGTTPIPTQEGYLAALNTLAHEARLPFLDIEPSQTLEFPNRQIGIFFRGPNEGGHASPIQRRFLIWTLVQAVGFFKELQTLTDYGFTPEYDGRSVGFVKFMRLGAEGNEPVPMLGDNTTNALSLTTSPSTPPLLSAPNSQIQVTLTYLPPPPPPTPPIPSRELFWLLASVYGYLAILSPTDIAISNHFQPDDCILAMNVAIADPRRIVEEPFYRNVHVLDALDYVVLRTVREGRYGELYALVFLVEGGGGGGGSGGRGGRRIELGGVQVVRSVRGEGGGIGGGGVS